MSLLFNKSTIKIIRHLDSGVMVVELQRPSNREKNEFSGAVVEISADKAAERIDKVDELRIQIYDKLARELYSLVKDGKTKEPVVDESGAVLGAKDLPDSEKSDIVQRALEVNPYYVKN